MTDRLTAAETTEDLRRGYEAACRTVSGTAPVHDDPAGANGVVARNLADLLIARGLDPEGLAMVAVLLRAEAYRRVKAAREIVRLTNSQSAQRGLQLSQAGEGGADRGDPVGTSMMDGEPMRGRAGAADTPASSNRLGLGVPEAERCVPRSIGDTVIKYSDAQ